MTAAANAVDRVVIRVDASVRGGLGHLRRCAVLGRHLCQRGVQVHFLVRTSDIDARAEVGTFAHDCIILGAEQVGENDARAVVNYCRRVAADRLIVDHYHADNAYQQCLLEGGTPWLQFDGETGVALWADWVLSMSPGAAAERYAALRRRPQTQWLLGPAYAILRDEFAVARPSRRQPPRTRNLLLTFGGGDDYGANLLCLAALREIAWDGPVDMVLGGQSPARTAVETWAAQSPGFPVRLHIDAHNMADLMAQADLAVIAGGTTSFETATLGTPALIIRTVANQRSNAEGWQSIGAAIDLGDIDGLTPAVVGEQIAALAGDPQRRTVMSEAGRSAVDGRGADRIVAALCSTRATHGQGMA